VEVVREDRLDGSGEQEKFELVWRFQTPAAFQNSTTTTLDNKKSLPPLTPPPALPHDMTITRLRPSKNDMQNKPGPGMLTCIACEVMS
jgi:hypothetical protein